jgi:hypothetical protein
MACAGAGDSAIVLDADQQPRGLSARAVGEAGYSLDQVTIVEG